MWWCASPLSAAAVLHDEVFPLGDPLIEVLLIQGDDLQMYVRHLIAGTPAMDHPLVRIGIIRVAGGIVVV